MIYDATKFVCDFCEGYKYTDDYNVPDGWVAEIRTSTRVEHGYHLHNTKRFTFCSVGCANAWDRRINKGQWT